MRNIVTEEQMWDSMGASNWPVGSFQKFSIENPPPGFSLDLHDPVAIIYGSHAETIR